MAYPQLPVNSTILLDTNFFFDYFNNKDKYSDFLLESQKMDCSLVSIDLVKCEFIRTKNVDILNKKAEFFNKTISTVLPLDKEVHALIQSTIKEYGSDSEGVSPVDFYLACCLKRYKGLYLLTRNHKDFPARIFARSHIFSIEIEKDIRTYALYSYHTKTDKIIEEINPDDIPF